MKITVENIIKKIDKLDKKLTVYQDEVGILSIGEFESIPDRFQYRGMKLNLTYSETIKLCSHMCQLRSKSLKKVKELNNKLNLTQLEEYLEC